MAAIKDEKEDNKTGKMLALFDIMIHGHPLTKEQIATRFDVNARTANRYLAAIRQYLEEAEKEDGPRRELRYSREDRTYRIAEVENRFISKSELFAICKILLGGRTYSRKDLESLMNRLLQSAVLPEEQEEIKEFVKRELFDYLDPSHGKPDMDQLWEVAQAIKKHHVITFDYTKIGSAQGTPHRALPLGVVFSEYYFYVIALPFGDDHKPDPTVDTRTYRLDRMSDVEETKIKWDVPYNKRFREGVFKNQTQYMFSGSITLETVAIIEDAVCRRLNIVVVGGTSSGKTTFVNAVIDAIYRLTPSHRLIILEDTAELQSKSPNTVFMRTSVLAEVDMRKLAKVSMRYAPKRILVGEVRDAAALEMLKL